MASSGFRKTSGSRPHTRQHGVALILVLWLVVLLAAMAAGHAQIAHSDTTLAAQQIQQLKARSVAEAAVYELILEFLARDPRAEIPLDGSVIEIPVLGRPVLVAMRNVTGLVDINAAGAELLSVALRAAGSNEDQTAMLVDGILDWRDADDNPRLHGAETSAYENAGVPWKPRNGRFTAIEELRYVLGMTDSIYEGLAPIVTVHSRIAGINVEYAPPALLKALVGSEVSPSRLGQGSSTGPGVRGGAFQVYASAAGSSAIRASLEVVISISSSGAEPFSILEWREPPRTPFPPTGEVL
jgi:general secretion pathway protein K